jgi:uncharacterized repeat protein (TIGR03803 family)
MKLGSTANVKQFENSNKLGTALTQINLTQIKEMMLACGSWSASLAAMITMALLLTVATQVHAAQVVTLLHSFSGGNDGAFPYAGLTADAAGNLYGTSQIAGANGFGNVFQLSPVAGGGWRFSVIYEFTGEADGGSPLGSLIFDAAGDAYGTAAGGGAQGLGDVFKLTRPKGRQAGAKWEEKVLYSFQGGTDGAVPFGNVLFDAVGNLFGTTSIGGHSHIGCLSGCGTIYELSPTSDGRWHERVLHRFIDAFGEGAEPRTGLVSDGAGNLYGTTFSGGNNSVGECNTVTTLGCGTVFELIPSSTGHWHLKTLRDFNGTDGALPRAGVTLNGTSTLYGATTSGGTNNAGTVFSFTNESGVWKPGNVYSFNGTNGLAPFGNLALDTAGNLYGATYEGGANNWGAIFQLMPSGKGWTEHVLYNFVVSGKRFGASPADGVFIDAAGSLYLTTSQGGNLNDCSPNPGCGTVIKVSTAEFSGISAQAAAK